MTDESCVFCRIIAGEEMVSVVHEDEQTLAFMDISPLTEGHTLVISRNHHPTLLETPPAVAAQCMHVAQRIAVGIRAATGAPAVNLFSANGAEGGQDVPHFHLHLIPIHDGTRFPLQLPAEPERIPSRSQLDVMAARIGRAIQQHALDADASRATAGAR